MHPVLLLLLLFGALAAPIGVFVYRAHLAGRRAEAILEVGMRLGLRYAAEGPPGLQFRHPHLPLFHRGDRGLPYNYLEGRLDGARAGMVDLRGGDFRCEWRDAETGRRTTMRRHFSYWLARLPLAGHPPVVIRGHHALDRVAAAFGFPDIDVESAEFSRRYHVSSPDRRFAVEMLHPRATALLLEAAPRYLHLQDGWLLVAEPGRRWRTAELERMALFLRAFLRLWPAHLQEAAERTGGVEGSAVVTRA